MNAIVNNPIVKNPILPILNGNVIKEEKTKEAIQAMGMSACQARCLSCSCCSKCCGYGH